MYLSLKVQELAKENNIEAASIAVTYSNYDSYTYAAQQIKDLGVYIIILIIHATVTPFDAFEEEGIVGYPYYYLGALFYYFCIQLHLNYTLMS